MDYKIDTRGCLIENNVKARRKVLNMIEVLDLVHGDLKITILKNLHGQVAKSP